MTVVILSSHFAFVKPQLEKLIACKPRWRLGLWWRSGWWRSTNLGRPVPPTVSWTRPKPL